MALGTVQLGLEYGAANRTGMPTEAEAIDIIHTAASSGVMALDTARAYGLSERRIGLALQSMCDQGQPKVYTKLKIGDYSDTGEAQDPKRLAEEVDASITQSLEDLQITPFGAAPTMMMHYWGARLWCGGIVWDRLKHWHASGRLSGIGTSTYTPEEVMAALKEPGLTHIQLPFNLLDWRWRTDEFLAAVAQRPDVTIHARSTLLQGILASDASRWPNHSQDIAPKIIAILEDLVQKCGRKNRADLCLAYARSTPWITQVLVGCETKEQLQHNMNSFNSPPLTKSQMRQVEAALPRAEVKLLNPALWSQTQTYSGSFRKD
jgi:spore coat polysaccharide biosynthesis protein SpsF